ncbi:MAG: MFS transporter [Pseudomonadota bacterium]
MDGNLRLYPWFQFFRNLLFWQATWFLYFQGELSAAEAILLYAVYDLATMVLEVPSGWLSDKVGRRLTLVLSTAAATFGTLLLALGDSFAAFALGQCLIGASTAFVSGTDSSLLYESLSGEGREAETENFELRAWRYGFAGLALSAVTGGVMAMASGGAPFWASVIAAAATIAIALRFREPPHTGPAPETFSQLRSLKRELRKPVLLWLMALTAAMYVFSHIPFVFGQPLILETLSSTGDGDAAPVVSGAIAAAMMTVSIGASWIAKRMKAAIGLAAMLLIAFAMQVGLVGVMTAGDSLIVVAFLMLRMVPDALAKPFVIAAVQPELTDDSRATYLSIKSLVSRIVFAVSLSALSIKASATSTMSYGEVQSILLVYLIGGVAVFAGLFATTRAAGLRA